MGGGEGTRMWPLTHFANKHLLRLGGKPVIRIIAEKLLATGFFDDKDESSITIVARAVDEKDYKWEFRDWKGPNLDINVYFSDNLGIADTFYKAVESSDYIRQNDHVLLHYGDTITELDYRKFINTFGRDNQRATIAITRNIRHDYSQVAIADNLVFQWQEKPLLSFPSWTGIGMFKAEHIMKYIRESSKFGHSCDFAFDIFPKMVENKELFAYLYDGRWFDVGNLRSYQKLAKEYQTVDLNL
jgi:NDP-sugar pyrophosphorylase family protein